MTTQKSLILAVLFFLFAWLAPTISAENSKDYEGWAWDTKFVILSPHLTNPISDPEMEAAHRQMQEVIYSNFHATPLY